MHDHTYAAKPVDLNITDENLKHPVVNQHLVRLLYNDLVHIGVAEIEDLEKCMRSQADSELWHHE